MFDLDRKSKIVITGGAGFLGRALKQELLRIGIQDSQIRIPRSFDCDLTNLTSALDALAGANIVFHLAGVGGGIQLNLQEPGRLFYSNAMLGLQVVEAARISGVEKLICIGTSCSYPKEAKVPLSPDSFWDGYPEPSSAPYAIGKKILHVMLQSYYQQYGLKSVYVIPANLYGPYDNFDPKKSHVIPSLIRKFHEAKKYGKKTVEVWGDGSPQRDFLFVDDAARGILLAANELEQPKIQHLSSGEMVSISNIVNEIAEIVEFKGEIFWDTSKPNGQPHRQLAKTTEIKNFVPNFKLKDGLRLTYEWWVNENK